MENSQSNSGRTFFRGKMSKVLRLSIGELPSFATKSSATMSILNVTPKHSTATQNAIEYVKGLLLQSSQALAQNQQTIKGLLAERQRLEAEKDSRPTIEEFQFVQEQLEAQRELTRIDRAQIKQLQTLSEQQDRTLFQSELRFHELNQAKTELVNKVRSLSASLMERNSKAAALERQLKMFKDEIARLTNELKNKSDDLLCSNERLQLSISVQNDLKEKLFSLSGRDAQDDENEQIDCKLLLQCLHSHALNNSEEFISSTSVSEIAEQLRSILDHYQELKRSSAESITSRVKNLCSLVLGDLVKDQTDVNSLIDSLEQHLVAVKAKQISEAEIYHLKQQCCNSSFKLECTEKELNEISAKLGASNGLVSSLQAELSNQQSENAAILSELQRVRSECCNLQSQLDDFSKQRSIDACVRSELERLQSAYNSLQLDFDKAIKQQLRNTNSQSELENLRLECDSLRHQLEKSSNFEAPGECQVCRTTQETLGTLENQLILLSQEFESLQKEMVEMRSKSASHVAIIKNKDMCIVRLQEEIRLLSAPEIFRRCDEAKENRLPLSNVYK